MQNKIYRTKTGIELRVINGDGQGDGKSRGFLTLVDGQPQLDGDDLRLIQFFDRSEVFVTSQTYIGRDRGLILTFRVNLSVETWRQVSKSKKRLEAYLGGVTIDVKNYLYRFFEIGAEAYRPSLDSKQRPSRGVKTLTYSFEIGEATASRLGVDVKAWQPFRRLKSQGETVFKKIG